MMLHVSSRTTSYIIMGIKLNDFEISPEEFERLKDISERPRPKILENVAEKIKKYDAQCNARKYNSAYRRVLEARGGSRCLVDENGNVNERALRIIEYALRAFEMDQWRQMDGKFREMLKKKLEDSEVKVILKKLRDLRIDSSDLKELKNDVKKLYEVLSASGSDGLSARGDRFEVGATKIMNFLFPELFVMVDKYVKKALHKSGDISFRKYWDILIICRQELEEWRTLHGTVDNLLELDTKPTTLIRVFDKCAFIMGKTKSLKTYLNGQERFV